MFIFAPLRTLPKASVGCAKVPNGMPPAKVDENDGAAVEVATGAGSLRLMTSGSSELGASWSVLQAARAAVSAISGSAR